LEDKTILVAEALKDFVGVEGDVAIADGETFEEMVVGGHHVEQAVAAVAVEAHLSVTGGADHDRAFRGALCGQHVGPVEGKAKGIDIVQPVSFVDPGMNEKDIAGTNLSLAKHGPVSGG
jgi:hypothetical protein